MSETSTGLTSPNFFAKAKLTEGLGLAKEFNSNVQDLLSKMAKCEELISSLPTPSFIFDTISTQLQEHKVCCCCGCIYIVALCKCYA